MNTGKHGKTIKRLLSILLIMAVFLGNIAGHSQYCQNRLIKVTEQGGTVTEYEYDAENTRTVVIKSGIKTVYVTDKEAVYSQTPTGTSYRE